MIDIYNNCNGFSTVGGDALWNTLQMMDRSGPHPPNPYSYLTDNRLIANGLKIRHRTGE